MAELVNQRIEEMINELEQMRRTELYTEEEVREIARKRKEFEYKIQRRVKSKDEFVQYIAYDLALLEDIAVRRKKNKLAEKKKDIEYAIAKRLNKLFKQFIYRFQNDIEIYFQYIKFCKSVGFDHAISAIIGQMLQMFGDKPIMWQMASKWEFEEMNNPQNAREFLIKGIQRHQQSDILYLDLFKIELILALKSQSEEEKEKLIRRSNVVWKNGMKNVSDVFYLFKALEMALKYDASSDNVKEIKQAIWARNNDLAVWSYLAEKELEGCHWEEIEDLVDDELRYADKLKFCIGVYEEALHKFSDEKLCTKYLHTLLGVEESLYGSGADKVKAVKNAWMFGHEQGLLTNDMYEFGIQMLKLNGETTNEQLLEILDSAVKKSPETYKLWEEKLLLSKHDEKKMISVLQEAGKVLKVDDAVQLWNAILDHVDSSSMVKNLYKKVQICESYIVMAVKSKLLQKMYQHSGIKAARELYEEFIRTPPMQENLHEAMIDIELSQDKLNVKQIRKCYECCVQHHGQDNIHIWLNYMKFETEKGSPHLAPAIYRRSVASLKKDLVDEFIKIHSLQKIK